LRPLWTRSSRGRIFRGGKASMAICSKHLWPIFPTARYGNCLISNMRPAGRILEYNGSFQARFFTELRTMYFSAGQAHPRSWRRCMTRSTKSILGLCTSRKRIAENSCAVPVITSVPNMGHHPRLARLTGNRRRYFGTGVLVTWALRRIHFGAGMQSSTRRASCVQERGLGSAV